MNRLVLSFVGDKDMERKMKEYEKGFLLSLKPYSYRPNRALGRFKSLINKGIKGGVKWQFVMNVEKILKRHGTVLMTCGLLFLEDMKERGFYA